ncbi:hypothetical protein [Hymenobacter edaphi]|uniref:Uncharacterized protein n=1 Tax=Hymenobacter edaphi TaxID=2211146 RepID=A0A328BSH7_9BACT|nr:hypothetical protein [Hymenobacter edaphi]RAK70240.1 hypothetical protein DLM85_05170 [Hymenobacter edaphi]
MNSYHSRRIDFETARGGRPDSSASFTYSSFTDSPPTEWVREYQQQPLASLSQLLWYTLDGNLAIIVNGQVSIEEEYFPLFQFANLLAGWLCSRPADGVESSLVVDDYEHSAKLSLVQQDGVVSMCWPVPTKRWWPAAEGVAAPIVSVACIPEAAFVAASSAFIQQLQVDVAEQLGLDMSPLLPKASY